MTTAYGWMWLQRDLRMPFNREYVHDSPVPPPTDPKIEYRKNKYGDTDHRERLPLATPGLKFLTKDKRSSIYFYGDEYLLSSSWETKRADRPWPEKSAQKMRRVSKGFRVYTNILDAFINLNHPGPILCRVKLQNKIKSYDGYEFISAAELEVLWTYDATIEIQKFGLYCAKKLMEFVKPQCPPDAFKQFLNIIQISQLNLEGNSNAFLLFDTFGVDFENFVANISNQCKKLGVSSFDLVNITKVAISVLKTLKLEDTDSTKEIYQHVKTLGMVIEGIRYSSIFMNLIAPNIPEQPPGIDTWIFVKNNWLEAASKRSGMAQTHPYKVKVHSGLFLVGAEKRWFPTEKNKNADPEFAELMRRNTRLNALEALLDIEASSGILKTCTVCRVRMSGEVKIINDRVYATQMQVLWSAHIDMASLADALIDRSEPTSEVYLKPWKHLMEGNDYALHDRMDERLEAYLLTLEPSHEIKKIMEMEWLMSDEKELALTEEGLVQS